MTYTIQASAREFGFDRKQFTLDVTKRVSKEVAHQLATRGTLPSEIEAEVAWATKAELTAIAQLSDHELGVCSAFNTLPSRYAAQKP